MILVFDKATGEFVLRLPDIGSTAEAYALAKKIKADIGAEELYDFATVQQDVADDLASNVPPPDRAKARIGMLFRYENGGVVVHPTVALVASDKKLRREAIKAGKQTAKAAKKLDAFDTMTAAEFDALTAAKKWDIVFAFMKTNMSED
jgi:hypothetical protein